MKITITVNFFTNSLSQLSLIALLTLCERVINIFGEKSTILRRSINIFSNLVFDIRDNDDDDRSASCEETETATPRWVQIQFRKASHCKNLSITLHFSREKQNLRCVAIHSRGRASNLADHRMLSPLIGLGFEPTLFHSEISFETALELEINREWRGEISLRGWIIWTKNLF